MNTKSVSFCLVATIFVAASVYTMLTCKTCGPFQDYRQSLTEEQIALYEQIIDERQKIYLHGLILGTVVAVAYLYWVSGTLNPLAHSCAFVGIAMAIQYIYYQLAPKSAWMLNSLTNKEQVDNWLEVYKFMKGRYHTGMLLGAVGYMALAMGVLNN